MTLVTADELFRMPSEDAIVELIDGQIRRLQFNGFEHGVVASRVGMSLSQYVKNLGLGKTVAGGTGFILRRNPDTVRAPDFAFVREERWTDTDFYFEGVPDLAIEVISFHETHGEVDAKAFDWLRSGVPIVIVIDPEKQTAEIHRSLTRFDRVDINGSLDGGDVVPGWTLPLRDLFVP